LPIEDRKTVGKEVSVHEKKPQINADAKIQLVEPTADRVVLAHSGHLRVIAQSKRKTDKLDAQTLAEFLALDQIPEAWRPTPRVRHRHYVQGRITSVKNKLRHVLSNDNADFENLFTLAGRKYLATIELSSSDRLRGARAGNS